MSRSSALQRDPVAAGDAEGAGDLALAGLAGCSAMKSRIASRLGQLCPAAVRRRCLHFGRPLGHRCFDVAARPAPSWRGAFFAGGLRLAAVFGAAFAGALAGAFARSAGLAGLLASVDGLGRQRRSRLGQRGVDLAVVDVGAVAAGRAP